MKLFLNKMPYLVLCLLILFQVFSQTSNEVRLKAKIVVDKQDRLVSINGYAINELLSFEENIEYKLLVLKKSSAGIYSKNLQTGNFSILANEKKLLSNVKINLQKGELVKIYLYLRKNNVLITKDTLTVSDIVKKLALTSINEQNLEIRGLVIDEVFTKPGKDFYEYFYNLYNLSGANYPFIIKISEKPGLGISSQVFIKIDDRLIYSFLTRPKEEFLKNEAQNTIRAVENYSKYRKNIYKSSNY